MAEVYRAYQGTLDRYVAIKVLHAFLADDPEFKSRFEREAQNIAKLKHPNIVQVYDFDFDPEAESYYMVMELIDGSTLKDRLSSIMARGELLPIPEVIRIMRESASALSYAHSRNMIHRDVKPANLMLDHDNRVVLTDFGIAKIVTGAQFTASGGMVGTPAFMAPEQGLGEAGDERSDLYSLGIIMFQMLTGQLPYDAETPLAIILKHLNTPTPIARDINPNVPEELDRIVHKIISKEAQDRYQSAAALIEDLDRFAHTSLDYDQQPKSFFTPPDFNNAALANAPSDTLSRTTAVGSTTTLLPNQLTIDKSIASRSLWPVWLLGTLVTLLIVGFATRIIPFPGFVQNPTPTVDTTNAAIVPTTGNTTAATQQVIVPPVSTSTLTSTNSPTLTATTANSPTPSLTPTPSPTPAIPIAVISSSGNGEIALQAPDESAAKMMDIRAGEQVTLIGQTPDKLWFQVQKSNGLQGWVKVSAMEDVFGDVDKLPVVEAPTLTPTKQPTLTFTPSVTPTLTFTPTATATATTNPTTTIVALTQTAAAQNATQAACKLDYAADIMLVEPQRYAKKIDGLYQLPVNTEFTLKIQITNLSDCDWARSTALRYSTGEDFDGGQFIFFDERDAIVKPGDTKTITFIGKTPAKGGNEKISGKWILQTPGRNTIGDPLEIAFRVYG